VAVKHASVTVGTTSTDLTSSIRDDHGFNGVTRTVVVQNKGTGSVFLGGPGVTTSSFGYELPSGSEASFDLTLGDILFGVASSAQSVTVLHMGV
jgi:hypothetical protein